MPDGSDPRRVRSRCRGMWERWQQEQLVGWLRVIGESAVVSGVGLDAHELDSIGRERRVVGSHEHRSRQPAAVRVVRRHDILCRG